MAGYVDAPEGFEVTESVNAEASSSYSDAPEGFEVTEEATLSEERGFLGTSYDAMPDEAKGMVDYNVEAVKTVGDLALTVGTGAALQIPAGIGGLWQATKNKFNSLTDSDYFDEKNPTDVVREIQSAGWEPKSKGVKAGAEFAGEYAQKIGQGFDDILDATGKASPYGVFDSPIIKTAAKTAILGIPEILGAKTGITRALQVKTQIRAMEKVADEMGVPLGGSSLHDDVARFGESIAAPYKGGAIETLQAELQSKMLRARATKNALYQEAKEARAAIKKSGQNEPYVSSVANIQDRLKRAGFEELEASIKIRIGKYYSPKGGDMSPSVRAIINDIEDVSIRSSKQNIDIDEVFAIRKRANGKRKANEKGGEEWNALGEATDAIDSFMQDQIFKDMVIGDKTALAKWKKAIDNNAYFKKTFDDNKIVAKIIKEELSPEQVKVMILGANKAGANASVIVKRIKKIVGEDSPAMDGLRQELFLPIVEPLLGGKPNFKLFSSRVDDLLRNNRSLVRELSPESMNPLLDLNKVSKAAMKTGAAPGFEVDMAEAMSRVLFGHQIAKAALKVSLATKAMKLIHGTGQSERRALLMELTGVDSKASFIPKKSIAAGAVISDLFDDEIRKIAEEDKATYNKSKKKNRLGQSKPRYPHTQPVHPINAFSPEKRFKANTIINQR